MLAPQKALSAIATYFSSKTKSPYALAVAAKTIVVPSLSNNKPSAVVYFVFFGLTINVVKLVFWKTEPKFSTISVLLWNSTSVKLSHL